MIGENLRILFVEDDEIDRMALERQVQRDKLPYTVVSVATKTEALERLLSDFYDVALLDYKLSDGTAFDVLPHLRDVPAIVVTGRGDEQVAAEALYRGAYDYLIKDSSRGYLELIPTRVNSVMARKRAEEALIKSERRYRAIVEDQTEFICRFREDGTLTFVNQAYCRYLGRSREEVLGTVIFNSIHEEDRGKVVEALRSLSREHPVIDIKHQARLPDHGVRWHRWTNRAIFNEKDEFLEFQSVGCDITEHVHALQREKELQDQLVRSQRMESLGLLAGGVAHDLNNLLGPMVAYPDLLLKKFEEASQEFDIVMEIKRSASRAAAVIRDLLTLARRGRCGTDIINLNHVVEGYVKSAAFEELHAANKAVTLRTRLAPDLFNMAGSENNLIKVLMNLVINAYEAMPGKGELVVETANRSLDHAYLGYESIPPGDYVTLTVSDTGTGISAEDKNNIFEPFFTKKKMGRSGSGLGLSVVYGVVKDHRGFIDVKSQPGQGTQLTIYVPANRTAPLTRKQEVSGDLRGTGKILVVDDVAEQRSMAENVLKSLGYEVVAVENGRAAVKVLKQQQNRKKSSALFDLIILDMIMEEKFDGYDTYKEIARISPGQRCILVSGYSETERVKKAQALGAGTYLAKPYTREELGRAVREELERARHHEHAVTA